MPSAQVIDLNPNPRTETTPLEKIMSSFAGRYRQNQIEEQDADALSKIYKQYQQEGNGIDQTLQALQTTTGISPTRRVQETNRLMEIKKINEHKQQAAQAELSKKTANELKQKELEIRNQDVANRKTALEQARADKQAGIEADKIAKQERVIESNRALLSQVYPEEEAARLAPLLSERQATDIYKQRSKPQKEGKAQPAAKLTPYETERQKGAAKKVEKAEEDTATLGNGLKNLDRLQELSGQLRGLYASGKAAIGLNKEAAEMTSLSLTAIQPVLKVLNPVGAIPVAKMKIALEQAAPKPLDSYPVQLGKIDALRRIVTQAKGIADKKIALYEEYGGNPPREKVKEIDDVATALGDEISNRNIEKEVKTGILEEEQKPRLERLQQTNPASPENSGITIEDKKTGYKYKSDGRRWHLIP